jgi:hypothetical protein
VLQVEKSSLKCTKVDLRVTNVEFQEKEPSFQEKINQIFAKYRDIEDILQTPDSKSNWSNNPFYNNVGMALKTTKKKKLRILISL